MWQKETLLLDRCQHQEVVSAATGGRSRADRDREAESFGSVNIQPVQVESTLKSWGLSRVCCVCVPGPWGRAPLLSSCPPWVSGEGRPAGAVAARNPEQPEICRWFSQHAAGQRGTETAHLPGKLHPPTDHPGFTGWQRCWVQLGQMRWLSRYWKLSIGNKKWKTHFAFLVHI